MRRHVLALLLLAACSSPKKKTPDGPPPDVGPRPVAVVSAHPLFARLEQPTLKNACKADGDCHTGGCSEEMCTAEEGVTGPCDVIDKSVLGGGPMRLRGGDVQLVPQRRPRARPRARLAPTENARRVSPA